MADVFKEVEGMFRAVKIEMNGEEAERILEERNALKEWLEPMVLAGLENENPAYYNHERVNVFREDKIVDNEDREGLFKSAANYEDGFYRVPPIIE